MSETPTSERRTCGGTRKDGSPCGAWQQLDAEGLCRLHSASSGFDPGEQGRKGGVQSGIARRELRKTVRERLRELVEENAEEVWAAYLEALTASTGDGLPDYRARYQAASALLAEAYGKPMQPTHEQGGVTFIVERPPRGEWWGDEGKPLPDPATAIEPPADVSIRES